MASKISSGTVFASSTTKNTGEEGSSPVNSSTSNRRAFFSLRGSSSSCSFRSSLNSSVTRPCQPSAFPAWLVEKPSMNPPSGVSTRQFLSHFQPARDGLFRCRSRAGQSWFFTWRHEPDVIGMRPRGKRHRNHRARMPITLSVLPDPLAARRATRLPRAARSRAFICHLYSPVSPSTTAAKMTGESSGLTGGPSFLPLRTIFLSRLPLTERLLLLEVYGSPLRFFLHLPEPAPHGLRTSSASAWQASI